MKKRRHTTNYVTIVRSNNEYRILKNERINTFFPTISLNLLKNYFSFANFNKLNNFCTEQALKILNF